MFLYVCLTWFCPYRRVKNIWWFHAYKCSNTVSDCGHWLDSRSPTHSSAFTSTHWHDIPVVYVM